jgi:pimeloyl-ACP methyl ester carboxylesterase
MSNFRHRQVQVEGILLHVAELGDPQARPLVFLHGWPQCWAEWRPVMELAAGDFRAIAIDLPGVGASVSSSADGSKRALAAIVHGLAGQLGLDRPVIIGHDVGGMVGYAYLRRYHDAAAVVIIDVAIPGVDPWSEVIANPYLWHFAFHAIPALPELLVQGRQGPYLGFFFDALAADPARITPRDRATYASAYATDAALAAGFGFYRAFAQDARDNLAVTGATDTPVLYLRGQASRGDIGSYARGLRAAGVRQVATGLVPQAGHFIPDEQPQQLWEQLRQFITSASAPPQPQVPARPSGHRPDLARGTIS